MNLKQTIVLMVSMFLFMPTICFSREKRDSTILEKMWSYKRNYAHKAEDGNRNAYMRYTLSTERRNPTMFLIPSLYAFAKGDRRYISEIYGKLEKKDDYTFAIHPQVISTTVPHERQVSDVFLDHLSPDLYGMTLYKERILSPFFRSNRRFYRYNVNEDGGSVARITFRPKLKNTQLIKGYALIDKNTGRIIYTNFEGEFDMLKFNIDVMQGAEDTNSLLPLRCITDLKFNFLGNKITSQLMATYNAPTTLPDSLREVNDRQKMDSLRTLQLRLYEQEIYRQYDKEQQKAIEQHDREANDSTYKKKHTLGKTLWNIGDYLVTSSHADAGGASLSLSPIINPQYLSYSHSRGLSYKIQLGARYSWNKKRYLTIQPQIGYNFKIKQFYHYTPIRMTYNPKRNGYAEITVANGNRISNSSVSQVIKEQHGEDTHVYENMDLDYFTDNYIQAINNVVAYDWLEIKTGIVYHIRKPENVSGMQDFNMPTVYRSFAPTLTLHISPWRKGPFFTLNYERSIKGVLGSNLEYERYEVDVTKQYKLNRLRYISLKGGFGVYTNNKTTYFLDYANFRDQNLPGGWEDDWTGNFQLVNSQWYNTSRYYLRFNSSYESPLFFFSFLPWVGKYIEAERLYLSLLSIQHTRAYTELGYSFSTRFISIGAFASFLNTKFQDFGMKFTFELFRKW